MDSNTKPKVSIIIPVYNVEDYLPNCLDSVLAQTMPEIEIICVDDASADGSAAIMREYENRCDNVKCIYFEERRSAAQARKDALLCSSGETVMFVDSDDYLEKDACEIAYNAFVRHNVSILHFGAKVENCGDLPESRINSNQKALDRRSQTPVAGDVLKACFVDDLFGFTLWNKIYSGDMCRAAAHKIEDGFFPKANDLYLAFFLMEEANSYASISDVLYHYCFGRGMTGHNFLDLDAYRLCCQSVRVYRALERYVKMGVLKEGLDYDNALRVIKGRLINEQRGKLLNLVREENKAAALKVFHESWGGDYAETIGNLYPALRYKRMSVASFCNRHGEEIGLKRDRREIKTIALYYRNIVNGGAQRVVAMLANRLAECEQDGKKRYQVILVTSETVSAEDEYPLSPYVLRYSIPLSASSEEDYSARARAISDLLDTYPVDAFIDSMWLEYVVLWDLLSVRLHPSHPAFFIHAHSFCGFPWGSRANRVTELLEIAALTDGIVTLSEADRIYWSMANPNTRAIANPCFISETKKNERSDGSGTILWLGRISEEKCPIEALKIMEYVVQELPDARCHMVGDGAKAMLDSIRKYIADHNLENNVSLEGFHKDVEPYYRKSDLFVLTSRVEGFPLTLYESAAHGIPTVTYDLPWLWYYDTMDSWDSVPQLDAEAAAKRIVTILKNREMWEEKSEKLYDSFLRFNAHDILDDWIDFFKQYETDSFPLIRDVPMETFRTLFFNIGRYHTYAMEQEEKLLSNTRKEKSQKEHLCRELNKKNETLQHDLNRKIETLQHDLNRKNEILQYDLDCVHNSVSFRVGRAITFVPRKIRGGARCLRDNGPRYTFWRTLYHFGIKHEGDPSNY